MTNNSKSIKQELEEVQSLILENLYLQEKYPEKKLELELGLKSLKDLENEMFEALKQEKVNQKLDVYEIHLDGSLVNSGVMPMEEYGEFLINSQKLITSLAAKPLSVNRSPSAELQEATELNVYAHCSGSLKIMLISKQSKLDDTDVENPISHAFKKLNEISNFKGNISELAEKENIGKKQVLHYKNLMKSLSSMKLDMKIKKSIKNQPDEILCDIDTYKSYKLFKLISEKPKPKKETKKITGIIKALDLDKGKFKIESKFGDKTEIITSDFNEKYEEYMIANFNKEITVELRNTTEEFVDKNPSNIYELANIID